MDRASPASFRYRPDIDGLRAVAVLLVLIFHFSLVPGIEGGFLGVDIFFVISGFLITTIIKGHLDAGTFTLGAFYLNRIRRLAPALFVVLFGAVVIGGLWLFPDEWIELSRQAAFAQLYISNIYFWRNVNYFGLGAHNVYLLHTWSLAVEEQFYLLYPAFLLLLHRYARSVFWHAIVSALIGSFALNIVAVDWKPEATFYLLPTRAWELLIGAVLPLVLSRAAWSKTIYEVLGLIGTGLIVAAVAFYRPTIPFPGFFALLPSLGAAFLLLAGSRHSTLAARTLAWAPLVYIGKISYSLYLVHWPINVFATQLVPNYSVHMRTSMFALSVAVAALVYHTIENPFRRATGRSSNVRLISGYATGVFATLGISLALHVTRGLPQRFSEDAIKLAAYVHDRTEPLDECAFKGQLVLVLGDSCRIGAREAGSRWLVYGDSHAWAAHAAFDQWLKLKGEAGVFAFIHACPPLRHVHMVRDRGNCFTFNEAVAKHLMDRPELQNVVLVSTWMQAKEARLSWSPQVQLSPKESIEIFSDVFARTIKELANMGRAVFVWEPVPGARTHVPMTLARGGVSAAQNIEFTRDEYEATVEFFFSALEKNRHLINGTFSPASLLCKSGSCAVTYRGVPLYFDNAHITKSTADFWVRVLQRDAGVEPGSQ